MSIGRLNTIVGGTLALVGLGVAAAGPSVMPAFGVEAMPPAGGAAVEVPAEWRLVAFTRMFGVTVFVLGAALFGMGSDIGRNRVRMFAGAVAASSGLAFVVALVQQTAIWGTAAGAGVTATFGVVALAYGWAAIRGNVAPATSSGENSGVAGGTPVDELMTGWRLRSPRSLRGTCLEAVRGCALPARGSGLSAALHRYR